MIKAIIMDVDGIIIGEKIGYNSPHPHPKVLKALHQTRQKDIPVILCTAKPHYAIKDIIAGAKLDNPHITDGGTVIIDPLENKIVQQHIIEKESVKKMLLTCLDHHIYVEFYTAQNYFVQKNQQSAITQKHAHILQKNPEFVDDIVSESQEHQVTKIMPIATNEEDKKRVSDILQPFQEELSIYWAIHPVALPLQFCIVTTKGITKKEAVQKVAAFLHIPLNEILGIGDSTSDWNFMQLCGYSATLANGSEELKEKISAKHEKGFIATNSVDENGILDIMSNYKLPFQTLT